MGSLLVSAIAFAFAAASPGDEPVTSPTVEASLPTPTEQLISQYYDRLYAHQYDEALKAADQLHVDATNSDAVAMVTAMRATAYLGLKEDAKARQLIADVIKMGPKSPEPSRTLFLGGLITKQFNVAADAIDRMIANNPDAVRDLDWDLLRYFLDKEPKGEERRNEDRRIALARIGYGGDTEVGRWRAVEPVKILVGRGDFSAAGELLHAIGEPEPIEDMLIQKRFAALWPKLEQVGGPHLEAVRASSVASAERAYLAAPEDHEKLSGYVNALRQAGRLNDAIALRSKLPTTSDAMGSADEQMGWAVNGVAYALTEMGKTSDADQLMALLNEATIPDGGWRVSMIINRLEMLVTTGNFEKAATLLDVTEASAKDHGSPYAQQLVRRLRYCVLSSLGRREAAAKVLPDMLKHADDQLEATIEGLLCAGDVDKAEQLALAGLRNPDEKKRSDFEKDFVRALQPVPLTSDDPSVWQGRWTELRKRPAIAKEFARLGRDMPEEFLPPKPGTVASK